MVLSICLSVSVYLFVCSSVVCEICEVIRQAAARGGELCFIVSIPIHLLKCYIGHLVSVECQTPLAAEALSRSQLEQQNLHLQGVSKK